MSCVGFYCSCCFGLPPHRGVADGAHLLLMLMQFLSDVHLNTLPEVRQVSQSKIPSCVVPPCSCSFSSGCSSKGLSLLILNGKHLMLIPIPSRNRFPRLVPHLSMAPLGLWFLPKDLIPCAGGFTHSSHLFPNVALTPITNLMNGAPHQNKS